MQGFRKLSETWKIHIIDHAQRRIILSVDPDKSLADYCNDIDCVFQCDITYRDLPISAYEPIRSYYDVAGDNAIYLSYPYMEPRLSLYGCPTALECVGLVPECMLSTFEGFRKIEY